MIGTSEYFAKALSTGSTSLFAPVFHGGKCAHANRRAVATKHAHKLRHVFGLIAIHHHAVAMFQRPARAARFEDYCISTQFVDADLHRRARAQAGIEEHQRH